MASLQEVLIRDPIHEPLIIDSRVVAPNCFCCYCAMTNRQKDKCLLAWIFIFISCLIAALIIGIAYGCSVTVRRPS